MDTNHLLTTNKSFKNCCPWSLMVFSLTEASQAMEEEVTMHCAIVTWPRHCSTHTSVFLMQGFGHLVSHAGTEASFKEHLGFF